MQAMKPSRKVSERVALVEDQISRLEKRLAGDNGTAASKRRLEVLEFQTQQLKKRMEKYGTVDQRQINQLNMMLNRALRASTSWPQEKIVKVDETKYTHCAHLQQPPPLRPRSLRSPPGIPSPPPVC